MFVGAKRTEEHRIGPKLSHPFAIVKAMSAGFTSNRKSQQGRKAAPGETTDRGPRHLRLVHSAPATAPAFGVHEPDTAADLGLVADETTVPASDRRARDHAPLSPLGKGLRREVLISGMSSGATVDPDALSAILSAKSMHHRVPLTLFTEDIVWQLLWIDVHQWCGRRRVPVPESVPHTLWNLLSHLHDTQQLALGSDSIELLHGPIVSNCAFDEQGRSRHPTGRRNA